MFTDVYWCNVSASHHFVSFVYENPDRSTGGAKCLAVSRALQATAESPEFFDPINLFVS